MPESPQGSSTATIATGEDVDAPVRLVPLPLSAASTEVAPTTNAAEKSAIFKIRVMMRFHSKNIRQKGVGLI